MKPRTVLLGLLALGIVAVGARAQSRAAARRTVEVAVALVDSLSRPENRAEILRYSDPSRPDVILLRRDATASSLATAIMSYRGSVRGRATRPGRIGRTVITAEQSAAPASERLRARAASMLAKLRREPPSRVGDYGRGRWGTFRIRVGG